MVVYYEKRLERIVMAGSKSNSNGHCRMVRSRRKRIVDSAHEERPCEGLGDCNLCLFRTCCTYNDFINALRDFENGTENQEFGDN
ncbi:hypothetical protein [Sigmofec virus UA08Rod_6079]|uniref:Uncharacterized protein n=1 Tax=Sigmofec virus UA08Rod_6079 TaxID=2929450 RepID=A0A976N0R0_9VIRU|nr:hypothetical protein [Sigmofec virus UA08Rod_6079]